MTTQAGAGLPRRPTTVLNLKGRVHENEGQVPAGVVYIGGKATQGGWHLAATEWANPYRPGKDGTREEVVGLFLTYLHCVRPDLLGRVGELRGEVLACWCVPELCHGELLAHLAERPYP